MLRLLKIAVSALSVVAFVTVLIFWVRVHRMFDCFVWPVSKSQVLVVDTAYKGVLVGIYDHIAIGFEWDSMIANPKETPLAPWSIVSRGDLQAVNVPYWFLVVLTGFAAIAPWIITRFNLKTMLTVTAFLAVVMGVIAYQVRGN